MKLEEKNSTMFTVTRTGGYLTLAGILLGTTFGIYSLFNPPLFSIFINISQYEATLFFLGAYLPSFVVIVTIGYALATAPETMKTSLWHTGIYGILISLSLTLSALSSFNILSFLGSLLALIGTVLMYTRPAFKVLWKREACFFVETGALLNASASLFFLLTWLISKFLETYSVGIYQASYSFPYLLLLIAVASLLTFFLTPFLCLHGVNQGICGVLGLILGSLSLTTIIQNLYLYIDIAAYAGIFLASAGVISTLLGAFIYIKLFFSEILSSSELEPIFLYRGRYCPHCGAIWTDVNADACSACGRNLHQKLKAAFCSYCGLIVSLKSKKCSHCGENVESLPFYITMGRKEEKWITRKEQKGPIEKTLFYINRFLFHTRLSLKEFVYVCILTFLFAYLSFVGYVRTEYTYWEFEPAIVARYGFPLEWMAVTSPFGSTGLYGSIVRIMFSALFLDFILYFLSAFLIVYGITRLKER